MKLLDTYDVGVYSRLSRDDRKKEGLSTAVGDEGGFAPNLPETDSEAQDYERLYRMNRPKTKRKY